MTESRKYTFIIPVRNGARTLRETLDSIATQEYAGSQVIVVDNGSTDATAEIARSFGQFQYLFHEKKGRSSARNAGARIASGDYLLFVDADVSLHPRWLRNVDDYLARTPVDALATRIIPAGPAGKEKGTLTLYRTQFGRWKSDGTFVSCVLAGKAFPLVNTAACLIRRSSFERLGGFSEQLKRHEDLEFSVRLFHAGYLIGGTRAAEAQVTFFPSRLGAAAALAYLWRAFEVQFYYPWTVRRGVNTAFLKSLRAQKLWRVGFYALLLECVSWIARKAQAISRSGKPFEPARKPGHGALTFSFRFHGRLYTLKHHFNFVFFEDEVYVVGRAFRASKLVGPLRDALRCLIDPKKPEEALSAEDALNLIETGFFVSRPLAN